MKYRSNPVLLTFSSSGTTGSTGETLVARPPSFRSATGAIAPRMLVTSSLPRPGICPFLSWSNWPATSSAPRPEMMDEPGSDLTRSTPSCASRTAVCRPRCWLSVVVVETKNVVSAVITTPMIAIEVRVSTRLNPASEGDGRRMAPLLPGRVERLEGQGQDRAVRPLRLGHVDGTDQQRPGLRLLQLVEKRVDLVDGAGGGQADRQHVDR